jgi:hypothetical protein
MFDIPDWVFMIWNFLDALFTDEAWHFGAGFLAGLWAYALTWIILSVPSSIVRRLTRRATPMVVVFGIHFLSLVLALCFALISHYALDYLRIWYTMPLDPPLELRMP